MADAYIPEGDKFAAAEEQALGSVTDDSADAVVEQATEDASEEAVEVEEQPESEDVSDEPEAADESTPVEDQSAKPAFDPTSWDGNMSSLPEEIRPTIDVIYKEMERGLTKKFTEVAQLRKQLETKLAELQSDQTPKAKQVEVVPPVPTADLPPEVQERMWNERDAYFARKAIEEQAGKLIPQNDPKVQELLMEREVQKVVSTVQSYEGWSPEVGAAMAQIAQSHPYYEQMLGSLEGMTVLFHTARTALENAQLKQASAQGQTVAAKKAEAVVKKKASAATGAVSRPGSTRKSSAADNFAKSFEDAERAVLEAFESGQSPV